MPSKTLSFAVAALLLAGFIYLPGLSGGYVFDDYPNLVRNKAVQIESLDLDSLSGASFSFAGLLRRPMSMASFALNYYFFGPAPLSFKAVNIVIHLLCGIAVYWLTTLLLRAVDRNRPLADASHVKTWFPLAVMAIWLLHPMQVTSVLYVVQRMTSLATLFLLLGSCLYTYGRLRMLTGERHGLAVALCGVTGFTALALMNKENGVLLPLLVLVIEYVGFDFRAADGRRDRKVVIAFLAGLALPAVAVLAWAIMDWHFFFGRYGLRDFTLGERLLTEGRVLVFYLKNLFAPSLVDLSLYHDDIRPSRGWFSPLTTLPSLLLLAALLWSGFKLRTRVPLASLGILWFFAGHTIESSFLPLELAHDHRNYLPSFGIVLAVVTLVVDPPELRFPRTARMAALFALAGVLGTITLVRTNLWGDEFRHALTEAHHHPNSPRATYAVGRLYGGLALSGNKDVRKSAYEWLERASILDEQTTMPDASLIVLASRSGDPVKQEWIERIKSKLEVAPPSYGTKLSLAELVRCAPQGCITGNDALDLLDRAIDGPASRDFPDMRGDFLTLRGEVLVNVMNNHQDGEEMFRAAVATEPAEPQYRINLIKLLLVRGNADQAAAEIAGLRSIDSFRQTRKEIEVLENDLRNLRELLAKAG